VQAERLPKFLVNLAEHLVRLADFDAMIALAQRGFGISP
jgi:hypothetical protein